MADIITLYAKEEGYEPLFRELWGRIGPSAIEAKTADKRADVMVAGTMALARAMVLMTEGDWAAVNILLESAIEALKSAVTRASISWPL
jgi:alcohol dehydrogenase YqhD (iron-dependent ADH family)